MIQKTGIYETIKLQRAFFSTGKTLDIDFRKHLLKNLKRMITENESLLTDALRADLGKSPAESYISEIGIVIQEINHTLHHIDGWVRDKVVPTPFYMFPAKSRRICHPLGVVMIFTPWNYPVQLALMPLVGSIAAGNCTILKLSEHSTVTTELLSRLIERYFDREYIAVEPDSFAAVEAIKNERLDLIMYTGGPTVARLVSKAAATKLTPVILELGGKSPCIVDKTANIKLAARRIVAGKCMCSGQTCVAPDYLLVSSEVKEELIKQISIYADKFYSVCPCQNPRYPKIINKMHYERIKSHLDDGDIIWGGECDDDAMRISLTLMTNIKRNSKLHTEEIFGPILPVYEFRELNSVISMLSKCAKPLALYLFTSDKNAARRVLRNLSFGGGCVNDTILHMANPFLPFGGVGESGMGRYHGKASFESFSSESSVLYGTRKTEFNKLRYPPFGDNYGIVKFIMEHLT